MTRGVPVTRDLLLERETSRSNLARAGMEPRAAVDEARGSAESAVSDDPRLAFLSADFKRKAEERALQQEEVATAVREWATRASRYDQDELLAVLISELRARELKVVPRPFLDVRLDIILGSDRIDLNLVAEQTAEVAGDVANSLLQLFDGPGHGGSATEVPVGSTPYLRPSPRRQRVHNGKPGSHRHQGPVRPIFVDNARTTEVLLDEGAQTVAAGHEEPALPEELRGIPLIGPIAEVTQRIDLGIGLVSNLRVRRMNDGEVEVQLGGRRIGRLDDAAAAEFLPLLSEGHGGRRQSTMGIRHFDRDGMVHLWTFLPK